MRRQHHQWWSPSLGRDMGLLLYGHGGKPVLAFPSQRGRFWDWEGFGMIEAIADLLDGGAVTLATIDSIDEETWDNHAAHPADRTRRHEAYERYVTDEVLPLLRREVGRNEALAWATGASLGALHAANLFFRRPDLLDGVLAISGVYSTRMFLGDGGAADAYFHDPLAYLPGLTDEWHLERYRRSQIVVVTGQGAWEEEAIADTRALQEVLHRKGVDATFDYWGHDVEHHWHWWGRMLRHHLGRMLVVEVAART